jgi:hypothetical protein
LHCVQKIPGGLGGRIEPLQEIGQTEGSNARQRYPRGSVVAGSANMRTREGHRGGKRRTAARPMPQSSWRRSTLTIDGCVTGDDIGDSAVVAATVVGVPGIAVRVAGDVTVRGCDVTRDARTHAAHAGAIVVRELSAWRGQEPPP